MNYRDPDLYLAFVSAHVSPFPAPSELWLSPLSAGCVAPSCSQHLQDRFKGSLFIHGHSKQEENIFNIQNYRNNGKVKFCSNTLFLI